MNTVVLRSEFDRRLSKSVVRALKRMSAERRDGSWRLGGSQEIATFTYLVRGQELNFISETYQGLSVSGPDDLIRTLLSEMEC